MAESSGEKSEEPTEKKIEDSRKKGQVAKSRDLTGVLVFLVGLAIVKVSWSWIERKLSEMFHLAFDGMTNPEGLLQASQSMLLLGLTTVLTLTLPVAIGAALVGGLVDFLQVGPLFAHEALTPKLDKLNPIAGMKNMFSKKQLVELLKSMFKISVTAYVVYGVVRDAIGMVVLTVSADATATLAVLGELVFRVSVRVGLLFLLFAIFDIWWQRRSYKKDLMMTKDEVKREYKESEGDPHHKAKRREMHMEILEGAQMEAVKGADVVVTNPDHLAVALSYQENRHLVPRVVAKGEGEVAQAIKELARRGEVAILRNVPLAHALYRVEVGQQVPEELCQAVAEILGFLYSLDASGALDRCKLRANG